MKLEKQTNKQPHLQKLFERGCMEHYFKHDKFSSPKIASDMESLHGYKYWPHHLGWWKIMFYFTPQRPPPPPQKRNNNNKKTPPLNLQSRRGNSCFKGTGSWFSACLLIKMLFFCRDMLYRLWKHYDHVIMLSKNQTAHSPGSHLINLGANSWKLINHGIKPSGQQ